MDYFLHILILVIIYAVLAVSLDLIAGQTGLLSIASAAFYGIGAYCSVLLMTRLHASFPIAVLVSVGAAALISVVVSLPSLRLYEDYFVIATFCFQMILFSIFQNWMALTNGPLGIRGIPYPSLFGFSINSQWSFLLLASIFLSCACFVVWRLTASPFGRVLHAIRENEVFAQALGKNTLRFKVTAFAISAGLAALAGNLYAYYMTYIDPSSFTVMESILLVSMVIIGGAGSRWGPLVGAGLLIVLPEALRFIGLPNNIAANLRQFVYGALLILMVLFRPRGIIGRYGFGR